MRQPSAKIKKKYIFYNQQNINTESSQAVEHRAIQALMEISNCDTKYVHSHWNNQEKNTEKLFDGFNKGPSDKKKYQQSLQINEGINRMRQVHLPSIRCRKNNLPRNSDFVSKTPDQNQITFHKEHHQRMNSVCGFINYKSKAHRKHHSSMSKKLHKPILHKKWQHGLSTQTYDEEDMILENVDTLKKLQNSGKESVEQIRCWLKKKKTECRSLNKLLEKYCSSSTRLAKTEADIQNEDNLHGQNAILKIRSVFWNR